MSKDVSALQGSILMLNTMFGVGVLFLPRIFFALGRLQGMFLFFLIAVITALTMYLLSLAAIATEEKKPTYYSVCSSSFSFMGHLADVTILICCLFCCITYLTFITNLVCSEINEIWPKTAGLPKAVISGTFAFLIFLLAVQKDLSSLRIASLISISSIVFLSGFVFYMCFVNYKNTTTLKFNNNYALGLSDLLFALGCQHNMVAVFSQLKDKSKSGVLKVAMLATFLGGVIYMTIGMCGYFAIGSLADKNILDIISDKDSIIRKNLISKGKVVEYAMKACKWLFTITLCCSFAFQSHPARTSLNNLLRTFGGIKPEVINSTKYRVAATSAYVTTICIVTCFKLNVNLIVPFIGATCNNAICYIFPALAFIGLVKSSRILRPIAFSIVLLGVVSMIYMVSLRVMDCLGKK